MRHRDLRMLRCRNHETKRLSDPPDDAWQHAPAWGAIARRRVRDLSPRGDLQRRAVAGQRPGAHVRAAHGVRALRNYRRQRAAVIPSERTSRIYKVTFGEGAHAAAPTGRADRRLRKLASPNGRLEPGGLEAAS